MASGVDPASLYRQLGVAPSASPADVRRAYRAAVRRHHPDAGSPGGSVVALGSVVRAYRALERSGALYQAAGVAETPVQHIDVYA